MRRRYLAQTGPRERTPAMMLGASSRCTLGTELAASVRSTSSIFLSFKHGAFLKAFADAHVPVKKAVDRTHPD
jgi:hypothetical protein